MNLIRKYKIQLSILLGVVLALLLFLILFFNIPRLSYEYNEEYNGYFVKNAYGNSTTYVVPEHYKNKNVVGISSRAFYKHTKLEVIEFENSKNIKMIDRLAFSRCENLKSIDLENCKYIELNAFSYCKSLVNVKTKAISIGGSAFYKCISLKNIELPNVKYIGSMAFAYTSINEIYLPSSVIKLGKDAFYNCNELELINANIFLSGNDYMKTLTNVVYYE